MSRSGNNRNLRMSIQHEKSFNGPKHHCFHEVQEKVFVGTQRPVSCDIIKLNTHEEITNMPPANTK
jgi:hypothetical protein